MRNGSPAALGAAGEPFCPVLWGRGAESRPGSGGLPRFPGTRGFHQFGLDVGVTLQPVVGQQAVGAVLDPVPQHEAAPAVGVPVKGAVAEEAVKLLLPHPFVAGEVFTFPVLKPGVVLAGEVHGGAPPFLPGSKKTPPPSGGGAGCVSLVLNPFGAGRCGFQHPPVCPVVLDGLPLHLPAEQSHQGDGDVGQHEDGEGDGVEHFLGGGGVDVLPLGDGGKEAHHEEHPV